jgi:hypothetical protein
LFKGTPRAVPDTNTVPLPTSGDRLCLCDSSRWEGAGFPKSDLVRFAGSKNTDRKTG